MNDVLIDTNVAVVANGPEAANPNCVAGCIDALQTVATGGKRLVLDKRGEILAEYLRQRPHGFPQGVGDRFIVEAVTHQANPTRCIQVEITPDAARGYLEFPDDVDLTGFDRDDRKFVASAISHGSRPPILNAVDTDWRQFADPLSRYVKVVELCTNT